MTTNTLKRVLILGGGFGGLYTALHLEKDLAKDPDVEITLINKDNFFLFTPMLHEVAASDLDMTHIVNPIRKMLHKINFFYGDVENIDLPSRVVTVSHGNEHHHHELQYDSLVIALGSITNFLNLKGLEERALTMKSLGDAIYLRNHLISNLEEADFECFLDTRDSLLTVLVAGAGFAGVETIASVNDFLREAIRHYSHLNEKQLRLILVHSGKTILPDLGEKLGSYAQKKLIARGVEIRTQTRVSGVTEHGVLLSDGAEIETDTLVWTAGTSPNPLLQQLPCEKEKGRVKVNAYLKLPEWPGVFALGDCAVVPDEKTGKAYPPTAQHALREGKVAANNITASIRGARRRNSPLPPSVSWHRWDAERG